MPRGKFLGWLVVIAQTIFASSVQGNDPGQGKMHQLFAAFKQSQSSTSLSVPFQVNSSAAGQQYSTELYAIHPDIQIADVSNLLDQKRSWCELIILHPNLKTCTFDENEQQISVYVGRKKYQKPSRAFRVNFDFKSESSNDMISVVLTTSSGPFGSKNYLISFQAIQVPEGVFGRWYFDLDMGYAGNVIDLYYKTLGRNKVGFTRIENTDSGDPKYVRGLRGAIERNFMRYYLAMKVYLNTQDSDAQRQFEARINGWFDASAPYARQLRDLNRSQYVQNKRKEIINQRAAQAAVDN